METNTTQDPVSHRPQALRQACKAYLEAHVTMEQAMKDGANVQGALAGILAAENQLRQWICSGDTSGELSVGSEPADEEMQRYLEDNELFPSFREKSQTMVLHDLDGEKVIEVSKRVAARDLGAAIDYGRRSYQRGLRTGQEIMRQRFRELLGINGPSI